MARTGGGTLFMLESFRKWLQKQRIPLSRCNAHFTASDLRKFAEHYGDIVAWNAESRHILTHEVRGIECSNYRHPLPEHGYKIYVRYWGDARF